MRLNEGDQMLGSVDFRHLGAFQRVYQEKSYANAGQDIFTTRKSVVRMMQNLERSFECSLFDEGLLGELIPSAFAERLFNDLRFLNTARHRMKDYVEAIHEKGRVLHLGSSAAIFRTREFRSLFREFQALDGLRVSYSPIDSTDAGKALVSGHCDIYIGCWTGTTSRFVIQEAGCVTFKPYRRASCGTSEIPKAAHFIVSLDGQISSATPIPDRGWELQPLADSQWLHWLDHPEDCPPGAVIFGPDVQVDPDCWQVMENVPEASFQRPLHASFLRQHPYEFLPGLVSRIQARSLHS